MMKSMAGVAKIFEIRRNERKPKEVHFHTKINEALRGEVGKNGPEKWVMTPEKFQIYEEAYKNTQKYMPNVNELTQCEVCTRVFNRT